MEGFYRYINQKRKAKNAFDKQSLKLAKMEERADVIINIFPSVFNDKFSSHIFEGTDIRIGTERAKSNPL